MFNIRSWLLKHDHTILIITVGFSFTSALFNALHFFVYQREEFNVVAIIFGFLGLGLCLLMLTVLLTTKPTKTQMEVI